MVSLFGDSLQVIESGPLSAEAVMAKDSFLLDQLDVQNRAILHLYQWEQKCFTYGYFINPAKEIHLDKLPYYGIQMAQRPTGGGIIFHLSDFAFSILIPANHSSLSLNTFDNYVLINQKVLNIITPFIPREKTPLLLNTSLHSYEKRVPFCMAKPTPYDLIVDGKKVGGAAQRRTKKGLLHQASLSLFFPPYDILSDIIKEKAVLAAMQENTYCLFPEKEDDPDEAKTLLTSLLKNSLTF